MLKNSLIIGSILVTILYGYIFLFEKKEIHSPEFVSAAFSVLLEEQNNSTVLENNSPNIEVTNLKDADIENQLPLSNPPSIIKAIYATGYSAGSSKKMDSLINLINETELNALVIDIKDYSGHILYNIQNEDSLKYKNKEVQISKINTLIKKLHDNNIYIIARVTVFQDPTLAKARPDLALKNISGLSENFLLTDAPVWKDRKDLSWMDPSSKEVWDYDINIAKDALARGFDEINFDYIRFASDGNLKNIGFPFYTAEKTKSDIIGDFFKYLKEQLPNAKISADLFGLTAVENNDLGIGQKIEKAIPYFDAVAPMIYPSHFANGFNGYSKPAEHPYEIVKYSMEKLLEKYKNYNDQGNNYVEQKPVEPNPEIKAKIRPWLQDFNLGAIYDVNKVKDQIRATEEVLSKTPYYGGFMIWSPKNIYTKGVLRKE